MVSYPSKRRFHPFHRRLVALVLAWILPASFLPAGAPLWWTDRGVQDPSVVHYDYSAINQGQLKNLVTAAYQEMLRLPGGLGTITAPDPQSSDPAIKKGSPGWRLQNLVGSFTQTGNYLPVNLGQLKAAAQPFYDRLIAVGLYSAYPWANAPGQPMNYATANIGQAKNLFAFDLNGDTDGDGISDLEELYLGSDPKASDASAGLPVPLHLTAITLGGSLASLSWDANGAPQDGNFKIERWGPQGTAGFRVTTIRGVFNSMVITGLSGQNYHYRVRYFRSGRVSAPSATVSYTFKDGLTADPGDPAEVSGNPNDGTNTGGSNGTGTGTGFADSFSSGSNGYDPSSTDSDGDGVPDDQDQYPDDPHRSADLPIIHYAQFDLSGPLIGDKDVIDVAIDDDNNVAFFYRLDDSTYRVYTISSGNAVFKDFVSQYTEDNWQYTYSPVSVTAAGYLAGSWTKVWVGDPTDPHQYDDPQTKDGFTWAGPGFLDRTVGPDSTRLACLTNKNVAWGYWIDSNLFIGNTDWPASTSTHDNFYLNRLSPAGCATGMYETQDTPNVVRTTAAIWTGGNFIFPISENDAAGVYGAIGDLADGPAVLGISPLFTNKITVPFLDEPALHPFFFKSGQTSDLYNTLPEKFRSQVKFENTAPYSAQINSRGDIMVGALVLKGSSDDPLWVNSTILCVVDGTQKKLFEVQGAAGAGAFDTNRQMNANQLAAAVTSYPSSVPNDPQVYSHAVIFRQVDWMVDGNRDGKMSFTNPDIKSKDETTAEKPYRFWLNNDHDVGDEDTAGSPDWQKPVLDQKRDLEDFTRLWISFKGFTDFVKTGGTQLQMEWKPIDGSTTWSDADHPAIKLFPAVESDGGRKYVEEDYWAGQQLLSPYSSTHGYVGRDTGVQTIPLFLMEQTGLTESNPYLYFLFEGVTAGKGQLVLSLVNGTRKIVTFPPLYFDLRDIKNMYERWTVDPAADVPQGGAQPQSFASICPWRLPAGQLAGFTYTPQSPEEKKYIVFAHGWNLGPAEKDMFAETAYKRLWWQGYKGRFAAFQWPTTWGIEPSNIVGHLRSFDDGEFIAWKSAAPLTLLLNQLNVTLGAQKPGQVYLFGHSHGNVVAGEALRLLGRAGKSINSYAACEAAVAAETYDQGTCLTFPLPWVFTTPDIYASWLRPNSTGVAKKVNYFNLNDWALSPSIWELDEELKPDGSGLIVYGWNPLRSGDDAFWRLDANGLTSLHLGDQKNLEDRYEIMSYAAQARSRAVGRVSGPLANFVSTHDMPGEGLWGGDPLSTDFSDREWHSGQFDFTNMQVRKFWESLLAEFDLLPKP